MLPEFRREKDACCMRRFIALVCAMSLGAAARGQSAPAADSLQARLANFALAADDLQKHLPSFGCKETFTSQELRGRKVKMQVHAAGEVRVQRESDGKLAEHFHATELDGRPIASQKPQFPVFVSGGFKNALDYLDADLQPCFHYSLHGDRLDFESASDAPMPHCATHTETRGFALLNDKGDIAHMERSVPVDLARQRNAVPFGSIDVTRIELGGSSFLLSTHVIAEMPRGKSTYHWEATYADCRLFAVTVKIGPATEVEPENAGPAAESVLPHP